ncbi:hypothetical protein C8J57DRAFT_1256512 [Mycena rebaudengoi]|nr:hypothetical protein C8J57DRAFT_1256512 [Mycena rebaudengoi]
MIDCHHWSNNYWLESSKHLFTDLRACGWHPRLGSRTTSASSCRSDLSITATISGNLTHGVSTAAAHASPRLPTPRARNRRRNRRTRITPNPPRRPTTDTDVAADTAFAIADRGESGTGEGGAARRGHAHAHGSGHSRGSSTYSNASYSCYASYNSPGTRTRPRPRPRPPTNTKGWTSAKDTPKPAGDGVGEGWKCWGPAGFMIWRAFYLEVRILGFLSLPLPLHAGGGQGGGEDRARCRACEWGLAGGGTSRASPALHSFPFLYTLAFASSSSPGVNSALTAQVVVFPVTGFGVSVATDGALYPTEVYS